MNPFQQGIELEKLGKYAEALPFFQQTVQEHPESSLGWTCLSSTLLALNYNTVESLRAAQRALDIDPRFALAWLMKARALDMLGRPEEATVACNQALTYDSKFAAVYHFKACILSRQQRLNEALEELDRTLMIDSQFRTALFLKAAILPQQNRWSETLVIVDRILYLGNISPQELAVLFGLRAQCLFQMNMLNEAFQAVDQSLYYNPYQSDVWRTKAEILSRLGREYEARSALKHAAEINPNDNAAHEGLRQIKGWEREERGQWFRYYGNLAGSIFRIFGL